MIHQIHKSGWCIEQSERHSEELVVITASPGSCFRNFITLYRQYDNRIEDQSQKRHVHLQLIKKSSVSSNSIFNFDGSLIMLHVQSDPFSFYEQHYCTPWRCIRWYESLIKKLLQFFFKFFQVIQFLDLDVNLVDHWRIRGSTH